MHQKCCTKKITGVLIGPGVFFFKLFNVFNKIFETTVKISIVRQPLTTTCRTGNDDLTRLLFMLSCEKFGRELH